jgi:transcriptional regulator GlxA family with amidase domain
MAKLLGQLAVLRRRDRLPGQAPPSRVEQAILWMRENLPVPAKVPELAAMVNLSVSRFSELFKRETGYPVLEYFTRLKMSRACQLLDGSRLSVKEIAASLGFGDPLYFSRRFRGVYGMPPQSYRAVRKG